jgi:hypothetical protein
MNLTVASHKHLTKHSFYYEEGSLNLQKTYLSNTYLYVWQTGQPVPWQTGFQKSSLFPTSNRQKLNFKFHPCNNSAEICAYIHKHMSADSLYSSKPDFFKAVLSFKHTEDPFNDGFLFVDSLKRTAGTQGLQNILSGIVFFKIKGRTIFAFPAFIFKEAIKGIFFIKTAAEFKSFFFPASAIVISMRFSLLLQILLESSVSAGNGCVAIGSEGLKVRGINGEFQIFSLDETKTLSNKISHVFTKDLQVFA